MSGPSIDIPSQLSGKKSKWLALRGWLIAVVVLVGGIAVVQFFATRKRPIDVTVVALSRGLVEQTVASTKAGTVEARRAADVSVDAAGTIVTVVAREGAVVKKGQILLSLDTRDAKSALQAAMRERGVLQALVAEATVRHNEAQRQAHRAGQLRRAETVSQAALDEAKTAVDATAAALQAARARFEAQAAVIDRARVALQKCEVRAPFDGIVAQRHVEVGEWAVPGKVVFHVFDPSALYVRAEIDEVDMALVKTGLAVRVTLDPYRDRKLNGHIARVAPFVSDIQEQNRTVEIEVEVDAVPHDIHLTPGTSADVEIVARALPDQLRIRTQSLLEGNRIFVVGADNVATSVAVTIGLKNWEYAQVLGGAKEGDRVIVSLESELLKEGVRVNVRETLQTQ